MPNRNQQFASSHSRSFIIFLLLAVSALAPLSPAQQRREREPNSVYAQRRAALAAQVDSPIIILGFTGREESSQSYVFAQEDNFYYLTGHNEEGAALLILPSAAKQSLATGVTDTWTGPREILFLPARNLKKEAWNGPRLSPDDPAIHEKTGFTSVLSSDTQLRSTVEQLAHLYHDFFTILPYEQENGGYPHEKEFAAWLAGLAPKVAFQDIRPPISRLREIKSPGEIAFLKRAIDLSVDAHLEAMRRMRPGLFEYQIAAAMTSVHLEGGAEAEGYAPIVGAGFNSTVLHYDKLDRRIAPGDIVVLDVAAQFSGYSADITRTLPANGKFSPRQREIYEIVLAAQNAAIDSLRPGMTFCRDGKDSAYKIAYHYIDSHGKDLHGKSLGRYFIHGLGHNIGLDVHDPGDYCRPLEPGMIVTIEPGIYIPEENLGVRIEDDVLITPSGYQLLSERLPRDPDAIEKIMAQTPKP
jgi:Xaa-Pro aminopeptidase